MRERRDRVREDDFVPSLPQASRLLDEKGTCVGEKLLLQQRKLSRLLTLPRLELEQRWLFAFQLHRQTSRLHDTRGACSRHDGTHNLEMYISHR